MPVQGYDFKVMEVKITCPFNPAHQISDMQKHLTKCQSFNKDISLKKCPFNATHYIQEPEFMHHVHNCEDRHYVDRHFTAQRMALQESSQSGDLSQPVTWRARNEAQENHVPGWDQMDEDWMAEANDVPRHQRATYDPERATEGRAIYRRPERHMGKSERNQYRQQVSKQMQQLQNDSSASSVASSSVATSAYSASQLRRPNVDPRSVRYTDGGAETNPRLGAGRGRGQTGPARPGPAPTVGAAAGAAPSPFDMRETAAALPTTLGRGRAARVPETPGVRLGQPAQDYSDVN